MRLRVCILKVEPDVMDAPDVCPYPDCDGRYFKIHQQAECVKYCETTLVRI
jgi:hypothetical protein